MEDFTDIEGFNWFRLMISLYREI